MQNFQQQYPRKVITGSFEDLQHNKNDNIQDQDSLLVKRRNTYLLQNRAKNQRIKSIKQASIAH